MESLPVPWPRLAGDLKRFASNKRDRPDLGTGSNLTWLTISLTRNLTYIINPQTEDSHSIPFSC
jgi:hypothetical protein